MLVTYMLAESRDQIVLSVVALGDKLPEYRELRITNLHLDLKEWWEIDQGHPDFFRQRFGRAAGAGRGLEPRSTVQDPAV